jgi:hypothetical protein
MPAVRLWVPYRVPEISTPAIFTIQGLPVVTGKPVLVAIRQINAHPVDQHVHRKPEKMQAALGTDSLGIFASFVVYLSFSNNPSSLIQPAPGCRHPGKSGGQALQSGMVLPKTEWAVTHVGL